jgi:hypothetical protein
MRRMMDRRKGSECVIREFAMPVLRESYEDTLKAAEGALMNDNYNSRPATSSFPVST